jgi:fumarate reductase flavoprotein subunit
MPSERNSRRKSSHENIRADVVVIGGGGGLAAAVAAAEKGVSVLLLEKRKKVGGNIALANGFMAAESPVQRRLKIDARKKDMFEKAMSYSHWQVDPRIIHAVVDKSGDTVRWLEEMGVAFMDVPHYYYNQFPRTYHMPKGHGAGLTRALLAKCEMLGVKVLCETVATRILTDEAGAVSGVVAGGRRGDLRIDTRSVIIATGGYSGNRDLLKTHYPRYTENLRLYGLPNMGDGLQLASQVGAATEGLGTVLTMGPLFDGSLYLNAVAVESNTLWVNSRGERFMNEASEIPAETANALDRQPGKVSFSLFDEAIKRGFMEEGLVKAVDAVHFPSSMKMTKLDEYLKKAVRAGKARIASSWGEIAAWIGTDHAKLDSTVNEYNTHCAQYCDNTFYKDPRFLQPLRTPPFYALRCCQGFHGTIGGIKINQRMEVVNSEDTLILGLFAMGNDTGGWVSDTYYYVIPGTALSFALNSGRIAGENAAAYASARSSSSED